MSFVVLRKPAHSQLRREKEAFEACKPQPFVYKEPTHRRDSKTVVEEKPSESGLTLVESLTKTLQTIQAYHARKPLRNYGHILPAVFRINGKPYSLDKHYPMEPLYNVDKAPRTLGLAGRQVAKSTTAAALCVLNCATRPHFNVTCVTPLYETIRRFSANYVRPLIDESPLASVWRDPRSIRNVLQRDFYNGAKLFFTFAYLDVSRTRGLPSHLVRYDEIQDFNREFIPIIRASMDASPYGPLEEYYGTPLTLDNTAEFLRQESSQGEYVVSCLSCGHFNIPTLEADLEGMLGPGVFEREATEQKPGVVCAKCSQPISPRHNGRWVHFNQEKKGEFDGLHLPQLIFPAHYANTTKWLAMLAARRGEGGTKPHQFYNERCGISYDFGAKILTLSELKKACTLSHANTFEQASRLDMSRYADVVMGVDWGGGGDSNLSSTALAVVGLTTDGKLEVIFGWRSDKPSQVKYEATRALQFAKAFNCRVIAHDFAGHGVGHQSMMIDMGYPTAKLMDMNYGYLSNGALLQKKFPEQRNGGRPYYLQDKQKSLYLFIQMIKNGDVRFFKYDAKASYRGVLVDWLAYVLEFRERASGADLPVLIRSKDGGPSDFADACNYAAAALFFRKGRWPSLVADIQRTFYAKGAVDFVDDSIVSDFS